MPKKKSYRMFDERVLIEALQSHPSYIERGLSLKQKNMNSQEEVGLIYF